MNSLYNTGLRQTAAIQADIDKMLAGDTSAALQGQITASLAGFSRTIDDFDSVAKREMIKAKQEKAAMRVQKFRSDYTELKTQFDSAKRQAAEVRNSQQRSELLGPPGTRQRFPQTPAPPAESPFRGATPDPLYASREQHALREHSFIQNTETQLDAFIAQGQEVLNNLVDQRQILKGTQRRLLSAANTLGLSRDTISWIERRRTLTYSSSERS
ncbi:related to Golgi SNAP receptor complex member 2 [Serendipita indica DSM 11827]|uniref:Protein transport protein BOS1 n=1 Tax=Serendipita indica (strain DSM 11827) TaxID=1109443 RepID=G4TBE7_SERID|nr:related to Golgi SNAP receptor complex member 2 [Serendipita indica DSM 11827]